MGEVPAMGTMGTMSVGRPESGSSVLLSFRSEAKMVSMSVCWTGEDSTREGCSGKAWSPLGPFPPLGFLPRSSPTS